MHVRRLDGEPLRFGHRGWLWQHAFLLYDEGTDSLWHHQTGWALSGPLRGRALERLPVVTMTFEAWRTEHPETLVLPKPMDTEAQVERDVYAQRNAALELGVGVDLPVHFRLYPFRTLTSQRVIEEVVDGVPLVVTRDVVAGAAFAYDRRVGGTALSFERDAHGGRPVLRRRDGAASWYLRTGRPVPGNDAPPLRPLLSSTWETFAWQRQHPKGTTYPERVPEQGR